MTGAETRGGSKAWSWVGAAVGVGLLAIVLWRIDYGQFAETMAEARAGYLLVVPVAIAFEQVIRAWKWRQILHPVRGIRTLRLFGAIMAGYLAAMLMPGASPLLRSWLVARLEGLRMSAILATVAIDRLIDGVVFTVLVVLVLAAAVVPDPGGRLRLGLVVGGASGLVLCAALLWLLAHHKSDMKNEAGRIQRLVARLPARFARPGGRLVASFADGIVWPASNWRRAGIVAASLAIKLVAATHFLWAGLAFGVLLSAIDYLFLIVFLGFVVIVAHFARIAGGFTVAAIFALGLFGVSDERALAMVLAVQLSSLLTVAAVGAFALWRSGLALSEFRAQQEHGAGA